MGRVRCVNWLLYQEHAREVRRTGRCRELVQLRRDVERNAEVIAGTGHVVLSRADFHMGHKTAHNARDKMEFEEQEPSDGRLFPLVIRAAFNLR